MEKKCILFVIFLGLFVNAQNLTFSDQNFKTALLTSDSSNEIAKDLNDNWYQIDANNDGEIQLNEALQISYLNVSNFSISDLSGIENFTELVRLYCYSNQIENLDVTGLTNLKELNCSINELVTLNVAGLNNLEFLICHNNQLTTLDVTTLTQLKKFTCLNNQLAALDLFNQTELVSLDCRNNPLSALDLSTLINLKKFNASGTELTYLNLKDNQSGWMDVYLENVPNLNYICVNEDDLNWINVQISNLGITNCTVSSYCNFNSSFSYIINGNVKYDFDNNGCSVNDVAISNLNFTITDGINSGVFMSNENGEFLITVDSDNHTVTPQLFNSSYFTITPPSIVVDFSTQSSPFIKDFCIAPNGVHPDVEVMMVPVKEAIPGFEGKYKIIFKNNGTEVENGTIELAFDSNLMDFVSSSSVVATQTSNSLFWNFNNLKPFETSEIIVSFSLNSPMDIPALNIDDVLSFKVDILTSNNDETPMNNSFLFDHVVVGSFDPNDIICLEGKTITEDQVGEYVHYMIRFENTGNFAAQNIVIEDVLDSNNFDIQSLELVKASHPVVAKVLGNQVKFIFENINLDFNDATNDGYVVFKVRTLASLVKGDVFKNKAEIYFDFNAPIETNVFSTTVEEMLETSVFNNSTKNVSTYPNPTSGVITIETTDSILSVSVLNLLGQTLLNKEGTITTLDLSDLLNGNYYLKVVTNNGEQFLRIIKK